MLKYIEFDKLKECLETADIKSEAALSAKLHVTKYYEDYYEEFFKPMETKVRSELIDKDPDIREVLVFKKAYELGFEEAMRICLTMVNTNIQELGDTAVTFDEDTLAFARMYQSMNQQERENIKHYVNNKH